MISWITSDVIFLSLVCFSYQFQCPYYKNSINNNCLLQTMLVPRVGNGRIKQTCWPNWRARWSVWRRVSMLKRKHYWKKGIKLSGATSKSKDISHGCTVNSLSLMVLYWHLINCFYSGQRLRNFTMWMMLSVDSWSPCKLPTMLSCSDWPMTNRSK